MYYPIDYASPSVFESQRDRALVGLAANARRPVRFKGRVVGSIPLFRFTMRALGEAIWSDFTWASAGQLDPIITVHPDRIFFEGFSSDESVYAMVIADRAMFEADGEVQTGTTNIDFTAWLWAALGELRSSRDTTLHIGAEGFEVATKGSGGRFEAKVEVPDSWVRGFLQLQGAMALPGTRISARPVDLLAALRWLDYTKAKMSPRALRYEFDPGQEARVVLEPWEHAVPFVGTEHNYTELRRIRVWGRHRLRLIAPLLPFAERVDIYLKGRGLPHFYAVKMPGLTYVLGLTSTKESGWPASGQGFDLLRAGPPPETSIVERAAAELGAAFHLKPGELAERLGGSQEQAERALEHLCRLGRAVYDLESREFRWRELFEKPIDEKKFYPPDERVEKVRSWLAAGKVQIVTCQPEEQKRTRRIPSPDGLLSFREVVYRNWRIFGTVDGQSVEVALSETGKLMFGKCGCRFFAENLLNLGPCAHMLAVLEVSEDLRKDGVSSVASSEEKMTPSLRPERETREAEQDEDEDDVDEDADDER